jgi:phenylacetate-CoA oxygenase PaaI subunit
MAGTTYSPAAKDALYALIARLADNKHFLGRNYADWCSGAPTLESAVAAAAMAQDELGHARALYPLLKTLNPGAETKQIEPETRTEFTRLSLLEKSFSGWVGFVVANVLTDGALTVIFEAAQSSTYEPLAGRARKALQEEALHAVHGASWLRRLAREGGAVRAALARALREHWDETLCWFGPAGGDDPLSAAGILDADPDALRARFLAKVGPAIVAEKLDLHVRASGGGYELTAPLPWKRWDSATYRLKPAKSAKSAKSAEKAGAR